MLKQQRQVFHEHALDHYPALPEIEQRCERLAAEFPDMVQTDEPCGESTDGRPITPILIGRNALENGRPFMLITAQDHENERGTAAGTDNLAQVCARHEDLLDYYGYNVIVLYINPDGMAAQGSETSQNDEPFNLQNYMLNFYRAAGHKQIAWGMPLYVDGTELYGGNDILPEAHALMALMERYKDRLDLMHMPHNTGISDAHHYVSHNDDPAFFDQFDTVVTEEGFHLLRGVSAEVDGTRLIRPGTYYPDAGGEIIYKMQRDRAQKNGEEFRWSPHGDHPGSYLQKLIAQSSSPRDVRTAATEMPLFGTNGVRDMRPSGITRIQAVQQGLDDAERIINKAGEYFYGLGLGQLASSSDPTIRRLVTSVQWYLDYVPEHKDHKLRAAQENDPDAIATVAWASIRQVRPFYTLPALGMVRRLQRHVDGGIDQPESPASKQMRHNIADEIRRLNQIDRIRTNSPRNVAVAQALASVALMASAKRMRGKR